jgi:hypothetical protein
VAIVPDTKDWTWVLQRPCPECGFDTSSFPRERIAALLRENAAAWPGVLTGDAVAVRPDPQTWSALEYGCQDETALAQRYAEQDPAEVAPQLLAAAGTLADRFDGLRAEQWLRPGRRSDGASFTVETFGRYFIHDPVHHLFDVTGVRP